MPSPQHRSIARLQSELQLAVDARGRLTVTAKVPFLRVHENSSGTEWESSPGSSRFFRASVVSRLIKLELIVGGMAPGHALTRLREGG